MEDKSIDKNEVQKIIADHAIEEMEKSPVVAIGASAGGLEALSALLEHIPADLGLVYVVVQHLSPSHESILTELLEKCTQMPVHKVTHGLQIVRDHVYVIPPNATMSIIDSKLMLATRNKADGGYHPIDFFMEALACEYHHLAIGVILSGTGIDGTEGIRHIKAEGGITFAQDETARFQGMPRSAADSGFIDFILSPEKIANELIEIVKKPYGIRMGQEEEISSDLELKKIQAILHNRKLVDFSFYKQTTVKRRIIRRMIIKRLEMLEEYTKLLRKDTAEIDLLYRDLLINVTSFFREPAVYKALVEEIFPALLKNLKPDGTIRIWCPASASGEEAYSIAICLFECLKDKVVTQSIQIFGTDLNEAAIEKARTGSYPASAMQTVSPQRLKQFFVQEEGKFQIIKAIRNVCIFAQHNLLKDPPFSRMDIISCQNVMIYLEPGPQKKILQSFHYGLKPTGYLLLGKSEKITNAVDLFDQMDNDLNIYTKKPDSHSNVNFNLVKHKLQLPEGQTPALQNKGSNEPADTIDIEKESEKLLLSRYVPASIVVNSDYNIFRFHGPVYKYLQPSYGKATLHLLKMVREELVYEMRSLLQRVIKEDRFVQREGIHLTINGQIAEINIEVVPVKSNAKEAYYLIVFNEKPDLAPEVMKAGKSRNRKHGESERLIASLEYELREAREQIKSMTEEFDATRAELQSANEEVLNSNEELHNINEELETSREELQSTNEELTTINEELLLRNNDLKESIDYSVAIVETIKEPLVLLNANLRIRKANKAFYNTFKMLPQHVEGHFLYEIDNSRWNVPELLTRLNEAAGKKKGFITFELSHIVKDRILLFNAVHLEIEDKKQDRLLLTVQDVTLQRQARQTKEWLAAVVNSSNDGIVSFHTNRTIISWNKGCEEIFGYTAEEIIGKSLSRLVRPEDKLKQIHMTEQVLKGESIRQFETVRVHKDGHLVHVSISTSAIKNEHGHVQGLTASIQDITERKQAEESLKKAKQNLEVAVEAANMGIWEIDLTTNHVYRNLRHDEIYGYETMQPEWTVEIASSHLVEEDKPLFAAGMATMMQTGNLLMEFRVKRPNDEVNWLQAMGRLFYDKENKPVRAAGVVMDITERKVLERQKEAFIGIASHELKTPVTSIKAYAQILHAQFLEDKNLVAASMLEKLDKQVDRLTNLIKDLLDMTQIAEGKLPLHEEELNLNEIIEKLTEEMQRSEARHRIINELQPLPVITADKERIEQVITNLVSNALKYSPDADTVIIRTESNASTVTVSVQDFGIGMSIEAQQKVFERFFRANDSKTSTFPGLGLGLFISSEIINRHKGHLWVTSTENQGSVFYFSLPLKN